MEIKNIENKFFKRVSIPSVSQMIGIRSWVYIDYVIEFSVKSRKGKVSVELIQRRKSNTSKMFFS